MAGRPTVAVVGFPNVGKSTLVNRLAGGREAVVHDEPGVTRDRKRVACEWNGIAFDLLDTGGIDPGDKSGMAAEVQRQAGVALGDADLVVMVADAVAGIRSGELDLARRLQKADHPVLLAVNKLDTPAAEADAAEFHRLGLGEPLPVSATHGLGTGDLLDRITGSLAVEPAEEPAGEVIRVAVVGRPNVGKSSLVNRILGTERVIVSGEAGTTRDSIDTEVEFDGRELLLVDTAGLRKRSRVAGTVGEYAQIRTDLAIERADVALLVCDATEGVRSDDLRIGEKAMKAGCATLVVLNKWDVTSTDVDDARARIARKLRLRPEVVTCSALTGRNVDGLLGRAVALADRAAVRIPTPELNRFIAEVASTTPPPSKRGRRLNLLYGAQVGESPPRFSIKVNDRKLVSREWAYHLENRMREEWGLDGVPLVIDFAGRDR